MHGCASVVTSTYNNGKHSCDLVTNRVEDGADCYTTSVLPGVAHKQNLASFHITLAAVATTCSHGYVHKTCSQGSHGYVHRTCSHGYMDNAGRFTKADVMDPEAARHRKLPNL